MEDPNMEWEIQEYSPSKEGEVTVVRWIFNKGLWLGKKVVITGVAISSAPLVLLPLVVYSALGFAFSMPFGLIFASYACTNKLMNKLLPTPEPSPMLEYYTDEEEGNKGFGKIVMEEEEEKETEDTKRGVEMRIYLEEDDDYWQKDVDSWEEQPTVFNDENVKEEDYEEDVGEYVEGEDDCTQKIEMRDVNQGEDYIEYIDENVEEEGYIGKYIEVENDFTQTIEMRDENQGEDYKEYIDENKEKKGYEDDVGIFGEDDYTQKIDMRDENQEEEYKGFIGETVEVGDANVEGIEVREDDLEELVNQRSKDEEQFREISRVVVVVGGTKEKHGNDGAVKELSLVIREVKGAVEIKDELAGNKVKIGLDEIEPLVMGINIDKEEYKEDAGEYVEGEDDSMEGTEKKIEVREEGDRQKLFGEKGNDEAPVAEIRKVVILVPGNEDSNDNFRELEERDLVLSEVRGGNGNEKVTIDDEEDIVEESTGLLEKIRDEENVGNNVTEEFDDAKEMRGVDENEEGKSTIIRDPIGDPLEDDDVLLKKLVEEVKETGERERAVEETPISFEDDVKLEKPIEKTENIARENQKVLDMVEQVAEAQDKGLGYGNGNGNRNTIGYVNRKLASSSFGGNLDGTKELKPEVQEKQALREEIAADNNVVDQVEDLILKKRENVISSNADMREIADESGFDLFDDRNILIDQKSYTALQAKDDFSEGTTEVNVDYTALPTTARVFDFSHVKNALEKDEVPSSQVQLKEEEEEEEEKKIWELIDAMRAIVGYKVDRQPTCIQELEALYIFTGVEPPASFPSDLSDVNHKLRFLMSIVGVR